MSMYIFITIMFLIIAFVFCAVVFSYYVQKTLLVIFDDEKVEYELREDGFDYGKAKIFYKEAKWYICRDNTETPITINEDFLLNDDVKARIIVKKIRKYDFGSGVVVSAAVLCISLVLFFLRADNNFFSTGNAQVDLYDEEEATNSNDSDLIINDDPEKIPVDDPEADVDIKAYVDDNKSILNYDLGYAWNNDGINSNKLKSNELEKLLPGITVSYFQGGIDWEKVKKYGIENVIMRLGYRGYESGRIQKDNCYADYLEGAKSNNLNIGVYFFSQAINREEIDEELDFIMSNVKEDGITGPIAINLGMDLDKTSKYRTDILSDEDYAYLVRYFCIKVKENGFRPLICDSEEHIMKVEDSCGKDIFKGIPLWLYSNKSELIHKENCVIWQYKNYSLVDGVDEKVSVFWGNLEY